MNKKIIQKHKKLPEFCTFTVLYTDKGKIENLVLLQGFYQHYHFEDVLNAGRQEGKNWVDYMLQKRDMPLTANN